MTTEAALAELGEYLDEALSPDGEPEDAGFRIDTLARAEWALSRIADAERDLAACEAAAKEQVAKVEEWLARERCRCTHRTAHLRGLLESYIRERNAADPRVKSIDLPSGTLSLRKQPPKWHYEDEGALAAWAAENCLGGVTITAKGAAADAIAKAVYETGQEHTRKWAADKNAIKAIAEVSMGRAYHAETGEQVPGVVVDDTQPPAFALKLAGKE